MYNKIMKKVDIIIIGAGPVGLFTVFEAGLLGLNCLLIDNLDKPGGQCAELYPDKPIYDIPGVPFQTGQEHVDALMEQIKPFKYELYLNERVDSLNEINEDNDNYWKVTTNENNKFISKNIFIAAGAGSFEPRRPPNIDEPDKFIDNGVSYAVRSIKKYDNKNVMIFGGGDSALDWTVELSKNAKSVTLIHRRDAFRGAQHTEEMMRELVKKNKVIFFELLNLWHAQANAIVRLHLFKHSNVQHLTQTKPYKQSQTRDISATT